LGYLPERLIGELAALVINADIEILEELEKKDPLSLMHGEDAERIRKAKGHSMFCLYALSKERISRRGFQSFEYQAMWEDMGAYVRKQYDALSPTTKEQLRTLIERFKEATGEEIALES